MMAAQQPESVSETIEDVYGPFTYAREPVPGAPGRFRHMRIPTAARMGCLAQKQHSEAAGRPAAGTDLAPHLSASAASQEAAGCQLAEGVDVVALDEALRATASPSPAAYQLHSFAPSPTFDAAAFTEATEQPPEGVRRPDRFVLHVVDVAAAAAAAATLAPTASADTVFTVPKPWEPPLLLPPLPDVSGDVGWVAMAPGGGGSGGGGSGGGGARLFFTRAAQRELWCLDLPPHAPPPPQAAIAAAASTVVAAAAAAAASLPATRGAAVPVPRLAFRDPDGQPIQLVRRGRYLYAETLGNDEVPLEVRLLGPAVVGPRPAGDGADRPPPAVGSVGGSDGGGAAPASPAAVTAVAGCAGNGSAAAAAVVPEAGVPLLPRWPGRQYSVVHLELPPPPAGSGLPGGSCETFDAGGGHGGGGRDGASGGGGGVRQQEGRQVRGARRGPDVALVWLRDLEHCNGCLLLALLASPPTMGGDALAEMAPPPQLPQPTPSPLVRLLEVLPHDPARRIVHVEVSRRRAGRLLVLRACVGERGDTTGRLQLEDLGLAWGAPEPAEEQRAEAAAPSPEEEQRVPALAAAAVAAAAAGGAAGEPCAAWGVPSSGQAAVLQGPCSLPDAEAAGDGAATVVSAVSAAAAGGSGREAAGGGECGAAGSRPHPRAAPAFVASAVLRRRCVLLPDGRHSVVRLVAWDEDAGDVTLSYSSLASPAATSTVRLLQVEEPAPPPSPPLPPPPSPSSPQPPQQQREQSGSHARGCGSRGADEDGSAAAAAAAEPLALRGRRADPRVACERLWAPSQDGVEVPITLCRLGADAGDGGRGGVGGDPGGSPPQPRPQPLLLRVYGAYGTDPPLEHQPCLAPLLRRGVAVAVAHVRGGGRLGPGWYEAGRGAGRKANSYRDLVAAAAHLVASGVTAPELLCVEAESAGGWAAGPALNAAGATLFRAAVLTVPTLDVLTSLLEDPTYGPYELGDPRTDANVYDSAASWCPYTGLARLSSDSGGGRRHNRAALPLMLLRMGLYDTNVPYWDPAKYMARARGLDASGGAGPGPGFRVMQVRPGGHDAYDTVADDAMRCAFVLWALGVPPDRPASAASAV